MAPNDTRVDTITHGQTRANIPSAEFEPVMPENDRAPIRTAWERRNRDLDPQLVWRGKDLDQAELTVDAPPIYLQEQVHPKALIDDLRSGKERADDLFGHFGVTEDDREAEVEFYRHSRKWSNRMILGDGLQVMASLAEREGLRGQVQAIYVDPPYGIRFNSNFQWSTTSRDVKDGNLAHLTREPEQVKAFRDTWRDGIHSYLSYLRDRLVVARELLTESGSCFVQIGDENVHRVRALMDEVFGEDNFISMISTQTSGGSTGVFLPGVTDYILWYSKNRDRTKFRIIAFEKAVGGEGAAKYSRARLPDYQSRTLSAVERQGKKEVPSGHRVYRQDNLTSQSVGRDKGEGAASWFGVKIEGLEIKPSLKVRWKTNELGMMRLQKVDRIERTGNSLSYVRFLDDYSAVALNNAWSDIGGVQSRADPKVYVVQTPVTAIQRCLLMTTDPGDLVLDPTCGSGTTAYVAEQWGRRWITIDTSRVALALARARIMGAKYPWYLLADSREGQRKEAEVSRSAPVTHATHNDIRHGFVYERVPHVTLKSIANNAEIDVIWNRMQPAVEAALSGLNECMLGFPCEHEIATGGRKGQRLNFLETDWTEMPSGEEAPTHGFMEWEVPRQHGTPMLGELLDNWRKAVWLTGNRPSRFGKAVKRKPDHVDETRANDRRFELNSLIDNMNDLMLGGGSCGEYHITVPAFHFTPDNLMELEGAETGEPVVPWPVEAQSYLKEFWQARIARQAEIDASIAARADHEYLYDKPYEDRKRVRVAGPFTVESLSPHRTQAVDEHGELIDEVDAAHGTRPTSEQEAENYYKAIIENLAKSGVHQQNKADRILFDSLTPWDGQWIAAEGRYQEGETPRRAGIFIGPEYGTVSRADLVDAAREAADAGFDILIACAFNFEAHAQELHKLGRVRILHARMNADLHMAGDLKAGGGNLFVVFGEPDIELVEEGDRLRVELKGVDIYRPQTGKVESSDAEDIACWFIDTDYSGESFFVRHAYFPGADVPYKQLRATLKGEIDENAWESLKRTVSRPFVRPKSGRIAVKVINHLGDEVMKVMGV
nr:site-specific DNA-methyltransferase [Paracoccus sp. MC1854]